MNPITPKSPARLARFMRELSPGDLITDLNHPRQRNHQILVLDKKGEWLDLSEAAKPGDGPICLNFDGPWRWDSNSDDFINKSGQYHNGLIAPGISLYKGGGLDWLEVYRRLPDPKSDRWNLGLVKPGDGMNLVVAAQLQALVHRAIHNVAGGPQQTGLAISHILELPFVGREHLLDSRTMLLLNFAVSLLMKKMIEMGEASARPKQSRRDPLQAIFGNDDDLGGVSVMGLGPDGDLKDITALFGGDVRDLPAGIPPELGKIIKGLMGAHRQGGHRNPRGPSAHHPGNGSGQPPAPGAQPHAGQGHGSPGAGSRDHG